MIDEVLTKPWHETSAVMMRVHRPSMLVGEPGSGKTTAARAPASRLTGRPPVVLSATPETELGHLFGHHVLAGDRTEFRDGPLAPGRED